MGSDVPQSALRVLHLTFLEKSNYFLNSLFEHCKHDNVDLIAVNLGRESEFIGELRDRGAAAYALDCPKRGDYPRAMHLLRKIIRQHDVDIVNTHLFEPTAVGVSAARSIGKPAIITRHHSDAIYRIANSAKRAGYLALEHYSNRMASHIVAPAVAVRKVLVERQHVPSGKVSLIPYPQDRSRFNVAWQQISAVIEELGMRRRPDLVCVSRLHEEKGHKYLFDAIAELKREGLDVSLYLVGTGPLREALQLQAQTLGIAESVRFVGWRDDVLAIVAAADLLVHSSLHEALPSAVIEAMALQKPIVATDVSGARDIVDKYGKIVPPGDAHALATSLKQTIANLEVARGLAARGRDRLLAYMDPAHVASQYVHCYRMVLAGTARARSQENRPRAWNAE